MPGWSIQQIPPLNQDGSNCEIWRAVVRAVASQHNALVMLEREPFPDNQVEIEAAWQLKEFLMQVCGPVFKAALIPLSPYRGWEYLCFAVRPSFPAASSTNNMRMPPPSPLAIGSPLVSTVVSNTSVDTPSLLSPSRYVPQAPEGYPERDPDLMDIPDSLIPNEDSDENEEEENLRRCNSSPAKLLLSESEQTPMLIPLSKFKAGGKKKALIIGINYSGDNQLSGCVRDAIYLTHLLRTKFGFKPDNIHLMVDENIEDIQGVRSSKPTRAEILKAMNWLMRDASKGDSLFFSFSGHGGQVVDWDGDELDGWDQTICSLDEDIVDDELYDRLVRRVPKGARLTAVIDACHSATALDCPYMYDISTGILFDARIPNKTEELEDIKDAESDADVDTRKRTRLKKRMRKFQGKLSRKFKKNLSAAGNTAGGYDSHSPTSSFDWTDRQYSPRPDSRGGEVVMISACNNQEAAVETDISEITGILSYCLVEVLEKGRNVDPNSYTYKSLLTEMQEKVTSWSKDQTPQFSTSCKFNMNSPFIL